MHKEAANFIKVSGLHFERLWSWRESNPRPNRETIRFLHAYLGLHCRAVTRPKPPITALSSKTSSPSRGSQETISDLPAPLYLPDSEQHPEERCLVLSPCKRIKPVIYCTSIRQRERTLFRQLIVRPTWLWSPQPSLRMLTYHLGLLSNPVNPKILRTYPICKGSIFSWNSQIISCIFLYIIK